MRQVSLWIIKIRGCGAGPPKYGEAGNARYLASMDNDGRFPWVFTSRIKADRLAGMTEATGIFKATVIPAKDWQK